MSEESKSTRRKILVIDDEIGPRESLRFVFDRTFDVFCADSVDQGVELLKKESPDAIIMDIRMPEKSGIEGLREIRAIDPHVTVLLLTGYGNLASAQDAIRLGANDYIEKPFDAESLRETVRRGVDRTQMERTRVSIMSELEGLNRQLKDELTRKEHMASIGLASSQLVHDLRNPLFVVLGYVDILMRDLADSGKAKKYREDPKEMVKLLDRVHKSAEYCHELAEFWTEVGKKDTTRKAIVSIPEVMGKIREHATIMASEKNAAVEMARGPEECLVVADFRHIFRAVDNLVGNAVHALPEDGGVVRLSWSVADKFVEIRVADNGCGIPQDRLDHLFDKSDTPIQGRSGMGLGLFLIMKVAELHEGSVRLANNPGGGITATMRLPLFVKGKG